MLRLLLNKDCGEQREAKFNNEWTALHFAAGKGHDDAWRLLYFAIKKVGSMFYARCHRAGHPLHLHAEHTDETRTSQIIFDDISYYSITSAIVVHGECFAFRRA